MYKQANPPRGGIFSSSGAFAGNSFGNINTIPTPPRPPVAPPQQPQPQRPPQANSQTSSQNNNQQQSYHPMDPRSPQGFATYASMFKPVTESVMRFGGMPALMSLYGAASGSRDWQTATTKQSDDAAHGMVGGLGQISRTMPGNQNAINPGQPNAIEQGQPNAQGQLDALARHVGPLVQPNRLNAAIAPAQPQPPNPLNPAALGQRLGNMAGQASGAIDQGADFTANLLRRFNGRVR